MVNYLIIIDKSKERCPGAPHEAEKPHLHGPHTALRPVPAPVSPGAKTAVAGYGWVLDFLGVQKTNEAFSRVTIGHQGITDKLRDFSQHILQK